MREVVKRQCYEERREAQGTQVEKEKRRNVKGSVEIRKEDLKYLRKLTVTIGTCMNERQG